MPSMIEPKVLLDGLVIGESPRWHDDRLWFAHWGTGQIVTVDLDGTSEVVAEGPPGLGWSIDWLPDGRLLVTGEELIRRDPGGSMVRHAGVPPDQLLARHQEAAVGQPVDRPSQPGRTFRDDFTRAVEVDCNDLACPPVGEPETIVVPARRFADHETVQQHLRLDHRWHRTFLGSIVAP